MLQVSELYIYPIKSLGGVKVNQALITDRGFKYDRRWMLVDENNRFLSQREFALMALLKITINTDGLTVNYTADNTSIVIPLLPLKQDVIAVTIWDDTCIAQLVSNDVDEWFTNVLGVKCKLVFMPDNSLRYTDPKYTDGDGITSFSDAYPYMMIGQSSLDDLNRRLTIPVSMDRFRPNIVFTGGKPYQEDVMNNIIIGGFDFKAVKLCARCNIIMIDQANASKSKEPTRTLSSYRVKNNKIYFGQNLIHSGFGTISVGDELIVTSTHIDDRFIIPEKAI